MTSAQLIEPNQAVTLSESYSRKYAMIYGYARVSTTGQPLDAQLEQLLAEGCAKVIL